MISPNVEAKKQTLHCEQEATKTWHNEADVITDFI